MPAGKIALAVVICLVGVVMIGGYGYISWRGLKASAINRDNTPYTRHQWHIVFGLVGIMVLCVGLGEVVAVLAHVSKDTVTSMLVGSSSGGGTGLVLALIFLVVEGRRQRSHQRPRGGARSSRNPTETGARQAQ